ncbi:MAG: PEGA domain-containing protein [Parachlamydiaceae bacterium]|nr:PEGA domain-containing protein [Parachlamydiaceae bacterium]
MKILKTVITSLVLSSTLASLTSCATIVHGTYQSVGISSNPSNAAVWVDQNYIGNTPILVGMSRKDNHVVRIELVNFQPYELVLSRQISGWVFGNILFGGFIGLAVDAISGGLYKLTPEQVQTELYSNKMEYYKDAENSYVFIVMKPDSSWEKVGNLIASTP